MLVLNFFLHNIGTWTQLVGLPDLWTVECRGLFEHNTAQKIDKGYLNKITQTVYTVEWLSIEINPTAEPGIEPDTSWSDSNDWVKGPDCIELSLQKHE